MAERKRPHINRVAEELLSYLRIIGKQEKPKWLTVPVTVEMMTGPGDLRKPRPGIFLEVVEAEPHEGRTISGHAEKAHYKIHCVIEDVSDPSGACHDLMADVARLVRENPHLDERNKLLESGYIHEGRRVASIDPAEGRGGLAVGFVEVTAFYLTSDAAP